MPLKGVTPVGDPFQLYEKNRYDSADTTVGVWGTRLLLAWQSTTSSALPQILTREFDGSNLPPSALPSATILSDDRYRFRRPAVAGSPAGFALVFVGEVLGSHRLYLRLIEP